MSCSRQHHTLYFRSLLPLLLALLFLCHNGQLLGTAQAAELHTLGQLEIPTVANAGDINGDGYSDLALGIPNVHIDGVERGAVYLFLGQPDIAETLTLERAELIIVGDGAGDQFGAAVADAGDVNGDGFADLLVGAPTASTDGEDYGAVYLFHGSRNGITATDATQADATIIGLSGGDQFGAAVAGAGDVNGDGYADLLIGAPGVVIAGASQGAAYIFYGGAEGVRDNSPFSAGTTLAGVLPADQFGAAVAGVGDLNGDGFADIGVGAPGFDGGGAQRGAVYLFQGGPGGIDSRYASRATTRLTGLNTEGAFGWVLAAAGDVNGDGYADVAVSEPGSRTGRVYLFHGGVSGIDSGDSSRADTIVNTNTAVLPVQPSGLTIGGPGDHDGDGYADLAVSLLERSPDGMVHATVALFRGGQDGVQASAWEDASFTFGPYVANIGLAAAGDTNGDGYSDLVVGGYQSIDTAGEPGLKLLPGAARGLATQPDMRFTSRLAGVVAVNAGDVNGDGLGDLVMVTTRNDQHERYLILSSTTSESTYQHNITETATKIGQAAIPSTLAHTTVSGVGDLNGDGFGDLVMSTPGVIGRGAISIYLGSATGLGEQAEQVLYGHSVGDRFGATVVGVGDLNGDGFGDLVVGAPNAGSAGAVYLFLGQAGGVEPTPDAVLRGAQPGDRFGAHLSAAGDLNGDGLADLAIQSPQAQAGLQRQGATYLFYGSRAGLTTGGVATAGTTLGGAAVAQDISGVGDLNGDGFADLAIGVANQHRVGGTVYLFQGHRLGVADGPLAAADQILVSEQPGFGASVAGVGDLNSDGFADLAVGAPQPRGGTVSLFHGGDTINQATQILEAPANSRRFGADIMGDIDRNGDGRADLLVTAIGHVYQYSNNEGQAGRLFQLQQVRGGSGSRQQVAMGGSAHAATSFHVELIASSPYGRQRVKLQVEACPTAISAGPVSKQISCQLATSEHWIDTTATEYGIPVRLLVDELQPDTAYQWRARLLYAPTTVVQEGIQTPLAPMHSPWYYPASSMSLPAIQTTPFVAVNTSSGATKVQNDEQCALYEAVLAANMNAPIGGCDAGHGIDTIGFDPQLQREILSGFHIRPDTPGLPPFTETVVVDGSLAPKAFCGEPRELTVILDGMESERATNGLTFTGGSDQSTVRGLTIGGFDGAGLLLEHVSGMTVVCNHLGTDSSGQQANIGNRTGLHIVGGANHTVGSDDEVGSNVIGGNHAGIIAEDVNNLVVQRNQIGTQASGQTPLGNAFVGVALLGNGSSVVKGNNIRYQLGFGPLSLGLVAEGQVVAYANNITENGTAVDCERSAEARLEYNYWSRNVTAPMLADCGEAYAQRLGAPVGATGDATNVGSWTETGSPAIISADHLGAVIDARLDLVDGDGRGVLVNHGPETAQYVPFETAQPEVANDTQPCSNYYDFFSLDATASTWKVRVPLKSIGCTGTLLKFDLDQSAPEFPAGICTDGDNICYWDSQTTGVVATPFYLEQTVTSGERQADAIGLGAYVADTSAGNDPSAITLLTFQATPNQRSVNLLGQFESWLGVALLGAAICGLFLLRRARAK